MDRKSAEDKSVAVMLKAILKGSQPLDVFSSWMLAVTGAVVSLAITQADKTTQILSPVGLSWCEWMLLLCCCFGVAAKFCALLCTIANAVSEATLSEIHPITSEYFSSPGTIDKSISSRDNAKQFLTGVFDKFVVAQPRFARAIIKIIVLRQLRKDFSVPYAMYTPRICWFYLQSTFTALQVFVFFIFSIIGIYGETHH